jgi:hypothetical protein
VLALAFGIPLSVAAFGSAGELRGNNLKAGRSARLHVQYRPLPDLKGEFRNGKEGK